jgi:hypothetical protein
VKAMCSYASVAKCLPVTTIVRYTNTLCQRVGAVAEFQPLFAE